ncbi:epoxide hydrolase family protein [Agilicoccus flavus]|uniref:epoxide hydrolase family protein n=1 Tax=Agilicoccus flavus TaxID=2775968 RepID=UPI001CF63D62|nr:epoxide hydrolase family protein [Agilicoccus flavus]
MPAEPEESNANAITPFTLDIPQSDLDDLRSRLLRTRWPDPETVSDTSQGARSDKMRALVDHWIHRYDWRRIEARLNEWGQCTTVIDGLTIHVLHVRSRVEGARPLVLTHGWPGSVLEFRHVIGPLTDPEAHGGVAGDAFDLIIPSLPGFGFSGRPTRTGWDRMRTARAWAVLVRRLGYVNWFAHGGDVGAFVTADLAAIEAREGIGLRGIHLNETPFAPTEDEIRDADAQERQMLREGEQYGDRLSGYFHEMTTHPQTIGFSLSDSPVGLASWIYTMVQDMAGSHSEHGDLEKFFTLDELIDNIMLYWLPNTGASAARMYWEAASGGTADAGTLEDPVTVPTGVSIMPGSYGRRSRRWIERRYTDLVHFSEVSRGGHFAMLEQPEALVNDVRATFRHL